MEDFTEHSIFQNYHPIIYSTQCENSKFKYNSILYFPFRCISKGLKYKYRICRCSEPLDSKE